MTDHSEIRIGEFILHYDSAGTLWLSKDGGEGMGMGDETLSALESILEQFWEANF
jgi:hypothetical protein